ncbi:aminodeoxychorismate synthase component I [Paragemmobacter ruber]|uniref:Aminodeoxychorismate synthase component I n=1 Tax=Paragemmobacter ruber TaxID=1985673 RepID=A0ABW9Y7W1_9RHOB|nr:aminodeoxychorismate synthase component I [Rhodobacter ruber]NBE07942.1 aminodeoxychorismate synthase component I [Rhodobacter ruber]
MILFEHGPGGVPALFDGAREVIVARRADQVRPALARADRARGAGGWLAGYVAYEAGYALEPKLAPRMPRRRPGPLVLLGVFDGPQVADRVLARAGAEAGEARLSPLRRGISRAAYGAAIARVMGYIAAGDCYQINLTFPLSARLEAGTALGLYGALRARQAVGYGVFCDLGVGPVVMSRSPELFFRVEGGVISARPMKGTAPRDADPARDAALAAALQLSEKARAENLMIVDLLRNDIARISEVGSVKVPELYAVEPYATVHQMSSTVQGRLVAGADLAGLMAALFPCGSITGAPKIRAMEIIAEVEGRARGVYCGAMGWMAPGGDAVWNVAIRTLSLFPGGRVRLNVGGGVVQDSTAAGEWEEALWKARYAEGLGATSG